MPDFLKPWFLFRPTSIVRRAISLVNPPDSGYRALRTSWGAEITADPGRSIGRSIHLHGTYDLTVSEALARLLDPGSVTIDAGANVGYVTVLSAVLAGASGSVISFEPHPTLFQVLENNVSHARDTLEGLATCDLRQQALGASRGTALLSVPREFDDNDGLARITEGEEPDTTTFEVDVETIDNVLGSRTADLLKLDVEGFEMQVLEGAAQTLERRAIIHVVFEDHEQGTGPASRLLQERGYEIFSLGWTLAGPRIRPATDGHLAREYEAPSFLATLDPESAIARFRNRGWRTLRNLVRSR